VKNVIAALCRIVDIGRIASNGHCNCQTGVLMTQAVRAGTMQPTPLSCH